MFEFFEYLKLFNGVVFEFCQNCPTMSAGPGYVILLSHTLIKSPCSQDYNLQNRILLGLPRSKTMPSSRSSIHQQHPRLDHEQTQRRIPLPYPSRQRHGRPRLHNRHSIPSSNRSSGNAIMGRERRWFPATIPQRMSIDIETNVSSVRSYISFAFR